MRFSLKAGEQPRLEWHARPPARLPIDATANRRSIWRQVVLTILAYCQRKAVNDALTHPLPGGSFETRQVLQGKRSRTAR